MLEVLIGRVHIEISPKVGKVIRAAKAEPMKKISAVMIKSEAAK